MHPSTILSVLLWCAITLALLKKTRPAMLRKKWCRGLRSLVFIFGPIKTMYICVYIHLDTILRELIKFIAPPLWQTSHGQHPLGVSICNSGTICMYITVHALKGFNLEYFACMLLFYIQNFEIWYLNT